MARDDRDVLHHDDGRHERGHWDEEADRPRHRGRRPLSRRLMAPALVAAGVLGLGGGAVALSGYFQPADQTPQAGQERVVADPPHGAGTPERDAHAPVAKPAPTPTKRVTVPPAATPERTATPKNTAPADKPAAPAPKKREAADPSEPKAAEKAEQPQARSDSPRPRRTSLRTREPASPAHTTRPETDSGTTSTTSKESSYEDQVVRLTNLARARVGCAPLRVDARLRSVAHVHSADMAARDYFGHNTPDGKTPWDRIRAAGYDAPAAENIARGQQTPQDVTRAWLNSQGHRENMLNCKIKAIGVGTHIGSGGPWWTQDFGYR